MDAVYSANRGTPPPPPPGTHTTALKRGGGGDCKATAHWLVDPFLVERRAPCWRGAASLNFRDVVMLHQNRMASRWPWAGHCLREDGSQPSGG